MTLPEPRPPEGPAAHGSAPERPVTLHRAPVVLPVAGPPVRDGAVAVAGDRIVWVGPAGAYGGDVAATRRWPGVLAPGLVNAHTHLQYSDFTDLATGGVPFPAWLASIVARRATVTEAMWCDGARRGAAESLRVGVTCVADVVSDPCALEPLAASGLAGIGYVEVIADGAAWERSRRESLLATVEAALARDAAAARAIGAGGTGGGAFTVGVSPHTPYTVGTAVLRACVRAARERGLRLHPHLAESAAEAEFVRSGTGPFADAARSLGWLMELLDGGTGGSPTAYLDSLGALGPDTHVAHGVHLDAADRALLRERGTVVALCPRSNALLGAGEPPVAAYRAEGNAVAVGTDSRASSPSLDPLADVAALRELALAQGSPEEGLDRWLVEAVTVGGARALGLDGRSGAAGEQIGVLRPGARGELAAFDVPVDADPYTVLAVSGAGRCVGTVLAGRVVHDTAVAADPVVRA